MGLSNILVNTLLVLLSLTLTLSGYKSLNLIPWLCVLGSNGYVDHLLLPNIQIGKSHAMPLASSSHHLNSETFFLY
jgi:hypothetical protein